MRDDKTRRNSFVRGSLLWTLQKRIVGLPQCFGIYSCHHFGYLSKLLSFCGQHFECRCVVFAWPLDHTQANTDRNSFPRHEKFVKFLPCSDDVAKKCRRRRHATLNLEIPRQKIAKFAACGPKIFVGANSRSFGA